MWKEGKGSHSFRMYLVQNLQEKNGSLYQSDIHLNNSELTKTSANECDSRTNCLRVSYVSRGIQVYYTETLFHVSQTFVQFLKFNLCKNIIHEGYILKGLILIFFIFFINLNKLLMQQYAGLKKKYNLLDEICKICSRMKLERYLYFCKIQQNLSQKLQPSCCFIILARIMFVISVLFRKMAQCLRNQENCVVCYKKKGNTCSPQLD